jgi:hypothetical protein
MVHLEGVGTPGVIRTPDPLLLRQRKTHYLIGSRCVFFGLAPGFYRVFGRYCSQLVLNCVIPRVHSILETGTGRKFAPSADRIEHSPEIFGSSVREQG